MTDIDVNIQLGGIALDIDFSGEVPTNVPVKSGIAYQREFFSGQITSYTNGDDGWHYQNGTYDYTPPPYPVSYARLANNFTTLSNNNIFSGTNRYTDELGNQIYANKLIVDHKTSMMWYVQLMTAAQWATAISNIHTVTIQSFNDWMVPNRKHFEKIMNYDQTLFHPLSYPPFSTIGGSISWSALWTSQTRLGDTTRAYYIDLTNRGRVLWDLKTSVVSTIICRNYG